MSLKSFFGGLFGGGKRTPQPKQPEKETSTMPRPMLEFYKAVGADVERVPLYPVPLGMLYDTAMYSDVLQTILCVLRNEIFRRGFVITERWTRKCPNCGVIYQSKVETCERCGHTTIEPNPDHKAKLQWLIDDFWAVNENGEDLLDVLKALENDLNIVDDAYLMCRKRYVFDKDGNLLGWKVVEWLRISPLNISIVANRAGEYGKSDKGEDLMFCYDHRDKVFVDKERCPICGKVMARCAFKVRQGNGGSGYYSKDEICHVSKYNPSLVYGTSPIYSCWQKVVTLLEQDRFIKTYYYNGRPPKGLLVFVTPNANMLYKAWDAMLDIFRRNPHAIPPLAVESNTGKSDVKFIDFMHTLAEMEFTRMREEFRNTIGAVFGVSPVFIGNISTSGGLNNEGLQLAVTNRAVEMGQEVYNSKIFPFICQQYGIDDYRLLLRKAEERDEYRELQMFAQKIQNAMNLQAMGFKVRLNEHGDFEIVGSEPSLPVGEEPKQPAQQLPLDRQKYGGQPWNNRRMGEEFLMEDDTQDLQNLADVIIKADPVLQRQVIPDNLFLALLRGRLYARPFAGLTKQQSDMIKRQVIKSILAKTTPYDLAKRIQELVPELPDHRAENIARTEGQSIMNTVREVSYRQIDPEGTGKYVWIGPNDHRTTEVCKRIKARTAGGVSLDELKKIIEEEAKKNDPNFEVRDWTPHYQCRHTFIKVA